MRKVVACFALVAFLSVIGVGAASGRNHHHPQPPPGGNLQAYVYNTRIGQDPSGVGEDITIYYDYSGAGSGVAADLTYSCTSGFTQTHTVELVESGIGSDSTVDPNSLADQCTWTMSAQGRVITQVHIGYQTN